jgi:gamma-glutamyltranspeptidase/glutathione hydrolase
MGPPSSGGYAVIAILEQLERFDLAALGSQNLTTWHLFLESQRLAYADKEHWFGDPDFVSVPLAGLLDEAYLAQRSALIDPTEALADPQPGQPAGAEARIPSPRYAEAGTTHMVAVDGDGTMVSINSTVEGGFGSGLFVGGFFLNNELTDFTFVPEGPDGRLVPNRVEGGKRPMSSMSPVVVYDPQGRPFMTAGAAGGLMIPAQTARAIIGVIDFGLPLEEALGLPFIMSFGPTVIVEEGTWLEAAIPQLNALGHANVRPYNGLLRTTAALRGEQGWEELVRIR